DICAAAAAHRAAIHHAGGARVTRQFLQRGVILLLFQFGAQRGVFLHRFGLALIALQPCFLSHTTYFSANGIPIIFNSSNASSLLRALVTIVMSMPCCRLILSNSISGKIVWSGMPKE